MGSVKPSLLAKALSAVGADTWEKWSVLAQSKQAQKRCSNAFINCHTLLILLLAIKDHLLEERDFFFLPEAAWNKLVEWYSITGDSRPIQRMVIEPGRYVKQNTIEVYPLKLKLCIHPPIEKLTTVPFSKGHTVGKSAFIKGK